MICPHCEAPVKEGRMLCRACGGTLTRGFPRALVLLPVAFLVLLVILALAAFLGAP